MPDSEKRKRQTETGKKKEENSRGGRTGHPKEPEREKKRPVKGSLTRARQEHQGDTRLRRSRSRQHTR